MGNIGKPLRRVELIPEKELEPAETPAAEPATTPEPVPAPA